MQGQHDQPSEAVGGAGPASSKTVPGKRSGSPAATADQVASPDQHVAPIANLPKVPESTSLSHPYRTWLLLAGAVLGLALVGYLVIPWAITTLTTVSTDDAYVNGHVTFVAPRVPGQVKKVRVDDNYRVKKGDVLVELDKEPYQVQVNIKKAAVAAAETDLAAAQAQVRGLVAQARSNKFKLEHAIENVNNQVANLRAAAATVKSKQATLDLAKANLKRGEELAPGGGISKEELDSRRQRVEVGKAAVDQALEQVYAIRVGLGLAVQAAKGKDLADVPPDLDQTFSSVRQALADLIQSATQFGYFPTTWNATPKEAIAAFYKQDPKGDLDHIYRKLIPQAPAIKQAEAKLLQAQRDLDQAE